MKKAFSKKVTDKKKSNHGSDVASSASLKKMEKSAKDQHDSSTQSQKLTPTFSQKKNESLKTVTILSHAKIDDSDQHCSNLKSGEHSLTRGTSFSTDVSLEKLQLRRGSIPEDFSDVFDDSRRSSLTSLSLHSSPTSSVYSFNRESSDVFDPSSSLKGVRRRRSLSPVVETSSSKHGNRIWKKLPFNRKVHPNLSKHGSSSHQKRPIKSPSSRANSINRDGDSINTTEEMEKLRETNYELASEVLDKDDEVRRLNATIDQVNQTWATKIGEVMTDLEIEKKHNNHLRKMLHKEAEAARANAPKPSKRIPVPQEKRRDPVDPSSTSPSNHHNSTRQSVVSSYSKNGITPNLRHKNYHDANKNKQRGATRPYAKTDEIKKKLFKSLSSSKCMSQLSIDDLQSIAEEMDCKRINRGERLMQEGMAGHAFYILAEGECCMYKQNVKLVGNPRETGRTIGHWEIFGESDVFYHTRRVWSCKCVQPGVVWYMTKPNFRSTILEQDIRRKTAEKILEYLKSVEMFETLTSDQLRDLAVSSKVVQFAAGDYIIRQGSRTSHVLILKEGEATTTKLTDGAETRRSLLAPGQAFGISCLSNPSEVNVVAVGKEVVQCIAIPEKHFDQVRGDVVAQDDDVTITKVDAELSKREEATTSKDGMESVSSGYTAGGSSGYWSDLSQGKQRHPRKRFYETHINEYAQRASLVKGKKHLTDFKMLSTIGHGAYGKVELFSLCENPSEVFAIKKLSKHEIVAAQQQQNVLNEKNLQTDSSRMCPFITSMYTTMKDSRFVYFVMEFCPGGELFRLLSHANAFNEKMSQFYAGCVIEALAFLHSKHIIFRDLKPENVVFDKDGYCKLTDFGFAKKVSVNSTMRTYTYCGTPEYMAPEILLYQAQSFYVDLWTLGIFIFEMLTGRAPFKNKNRKALADSILEGIDQRLETPNSSRRIKAVASDLIKRLCHLRPEDRLGAGRNGISDVTKHSWFHTLNWDALRKRTLSPPWTPQLSSSQDMKYFSPFSRKARQWNSNEEFSGWDEHF